MIWQHFKHMFKQENNKNTYVTINDGWVFFLQQLGFFFLRQKYEYINTAELFVANCDYSCHIF